MEIFKDTRLQVGYLVVTQVSESRSIKDKKNEMHQMHKNVF